MKITPSTYHQMLSYLFWARQVDLLGSQLAARQCYQMTIEVGQTDPAGDEPKLSSAKGQ